MEYEAVADLDPERRRALFERGAGVDAVRSDVRDIVNRVREAGDAALRRLASEFDDVEVGNLDVTDAAEQAYEDLDDETRAAIEDAAANVREFHEAQVPEDWRREFSEGRASEASATPGGHPSPGSRELGRRFRPLERVGVYAPGGTAAYPSSVLMGVIPARVAGVDQVAVATPPAEEMNPVTLAAIHAAGADSVYAAGGAQAVAALAYGTETVDRVQKVVGPGNKYVTAAKAEVRGDVEIDLLAGPSELLVVADDTATPGFVAADVLAQAEHDPEVSVVVVTDDEATADAACAEIEARIDERARADTIRQALDSEASGVFVARSMSEAVLFAEEYAAEHLSIQAAADEDVLDRIDSAGSVFLGPYSPVAAGDYATGTNHVLPTNGLAKVTGGLSVDTFVRSTTVQRLDRDALADLRDTVATLAAAEGLEGHAASVDERFDDE
jgi:histidinol dehydrogenase